MIYYVDLKIIDEQLGDKDYQIAKDIEVKRFSVREVFYNVM